jgi:hypothetical protein
MLARSTPLSQLIDLEYSVVVLRRTNRQQYEHNSDIAIILPLTLSVCTI